MAYLALRCGSWSCPACRLQLARPWPSCTTCTKTFLAHSFLTLFIGVCCVCFSVWLWVRVEWAALWSRDRGRRVEAGRGGLLLCWWWLDGCLCYGEVLEGRLDDSDTVLGLGEGWSAGKVWVTANVSVLDCTVVYPYRNRTLLRDHEIASWKLVSLRHKWRYLPSTTFTTLSVQASFRSWYIHGLQLPPNLQGRYLRYQSQAWNIDRNTSLRDD